VYENDVMQFTGHEEGRIRFSPAAGAQPNALYYDYMVKDHLGNVRMVLTEEVQTKSFPPASMEPAEEGNESQYYTNINSTIRSTKPANYPADSYTSPNQYAAKLRGDAGTTKIGPAILLKVMAGDKFHLRVNSWWSYGAGGSLSAPNPLTELASVLANGIAGASGGKVTAIDLNNSGLTGTAATSFLSTQNGALTTRPRAFVNWVLLDENFNIAKDSAGGYIRDGYSNFQQVGDADAFTTHSLVNAPINKNGYLYIYVSNQSPNMDVYFDNLQVTHIKGPILEENHYYPFGLTMEGISSKALNGAAENKYKFNKGSELQDKEFSDGSGLDWYATQFRSLDPQLGRWWQIDPKPDMAQSPYSSMGNNPIRYNDPLGDTIKISFRRFFGRTREVTYTNGILTNSDGSAYSRKARGFLKKSVEALNKISSIADGKQVISELQSSKHTYTIKDASLNTNKDQNGQGKTEFVENDHKKEYGVALNAISPNSSLLGGTGGTLYFDPFGSSGAVPIKGGWDTNPITNLAHEMFHAYEASFGMVNNDDALGTGLGRLEYRASYFENQIRAGLNAPLRSEYWFTINSVQGPVQGVAQLLNSSGMPIYVPPTPIPAALRNSGINLIY
jgi:RHS repeat-associated protein